NAEWRWRKRDRDSNTGSNPERGREGEGLFEVNPVGFSGCVAFRTSGPRDQRLEHLPGVQEAVGARLDGQPSPLRKSQFGKPQIPLPGGDTVEREMLWGDLAEGLVANPTRSPPLAPVIDANVLEGLSQELPAEANVSTQGLREPTDKIL